MSAFVRVKRGCAIEVDEAREENSRFRLHGDSAKPDFPMGIRRCDQMLQGVAICCQRVTKCYMMLPQNLTRTSPLKHHPVSVRYTQNCLPALAVE